MMEQVILKVLETIERSATRQEQNVERMVNTVLEMSKFMGVSSEDRKNMKERLDRHENRISTLESGEQKKKLGH